MLCLSHNSLHSGLFAKGGKKKSGITKSAKKVASSPSIKIEGLAFIIYLEISNDVLIM